MVSAVCFLLDKNKLRRFRINNLPDWTLKTKIMEVKIKNGEEMIDATIEMVDGNMIVSPKVEKFEPKDGDILFIESSCDNIIIYKESDYGICRYVNFSDNRYLYTDNTTVCDKDDVKVIRPATEEEKKLLFDKLKEEGYEWDAEKKEVVKIKWKPKLGDDYWRVDYKFFKFYCAGWIWKNSTYEIDAYNNGYVFRTEEECQAFCDKLNQAIEGVNP